MFCFSTMDLPSNRIVLYNTKILYNRAISALLLFIFIGVTFGVFGIIIFSSCVKGTGY